MTYNVHTNNSVVEEQSTNLPNDPPKQKYYDQGRVIQTFLNLSLNANTMLQKEFLDTSMG